MASISTREYNPTTGALIGNISSFNFGKVVVGTHTPVKVIDFAFSGITTVTNIKLGISGSTLDVNSSPTGLEADGTAENGKFGIRYTSSFDPEVASSMLGRHFRGENTTGLGSDPNNVAIGNRGDLTSQFVYLDIEMSGDDLGVASGVYRIFFDFE